MSFPISLLSLVIDSLTSLISHLSCLLLVEDSGFYLDPLIQDSHLELTNLLFPYTIARLC
jgi:hypothetical protein